MQNISGSLQLVLNPGEDIKIDETHLTDDTTILQFNKYYGINCDVIKNNNNFMGIKILHSDTYVISWEIYTNTFNKTIVPIVISSTKGYIPLNISNYQYSNKSKCGSCFQKLEKNDIVYLSLKYPTSEDYIINNNKFQCTIFNFFVYK